MQKNLALACHKPAGFLLDIRSVSGDLRADLLMLGFSNEIMRNIHTLSEVDSGSLMAWGESLMSLAHTLEFVHRYWVTRGTFYGQRSDGGNLVRDVSSSEQSAGI